MPKTSSVRSSVLVELRLVTDTEGHRPMADSNSHDNVYGAAIMTKVIARVHPVHLMNVD